MKQSAVALPKTMSIDQQPTPDAPLPVSVEAAPHPMTPPQPGPIAPIWHTILVVAVLVTFSFLGASPQKEVATGPYARFIVYGGTFLFELIVVLVIWFGIRSRGVSMRELIGGRWTTVESFLLDIALAVGFVIASNIILIPIRMALGTLDLHHANKQLEET
ncbi:MAG TPA: hypothetical protein VFB76_08190, partial [Candidatus Angelobacter sp.]|nr:hypothetical protein [Candidatus Angelobacter sp.]